MKADNTFLTVHLFSKSAMTKQLFHLCRLLKIGQCLF